MTLTLQGGLLETARRSHCGRAARSGSALLANVEINSGLIRSQ